MPEDAVLNVKLNLTSAGKAVDFATGGAAGAGAEKLSFFSSKGLKSLGSTAKGIGKLGGAMGIMLTIAMAVKTMMSMIFSVGFKNLFSILGKIFKVIGLIIKPVGDLLAVGLLPILYILKPVGLFFRTLLRPYIKKAMEAAKLGLQFQKRGDLASAMESYALAAAYVMEPFADAALEVGKIIIKGLTIPLKILIGVVNDFLGIITAGSVQVPDVDQAIDDFFDSIKGGIQSALDSRLAQLMLRNELEKLPGAFNTLTGELDPAKVSADQAAEAMAKVTPRLNNLGVSAEDTVNGFYAEMTGKAFPLIKSTSQLFRKYLARMEGQMYSRGTSISGKFKQMLDEMEAAVQAKLNAQLQAAQTVLRGPPESIQPTITGVYQAPAWYMGQAGIMGTPMVRAQTGGYVQETGAVIVHKGETIIPAGKGPGSITVNVYAETNASPDDIAQSITRRLQQEGIRYFTG